MQLDEALNFKPDVRGFDSQRCYRNFSLTKSFRSHYGPGVNSTSNRNEYQKYFLEGKGGRRVGLTTLQLSCAKCLENWEPQTPGNLRACKGITLLSYSPVLVNLQLCGRPHICKSSSQYKGWASCFVMNSNDDYICPHRLQEVRAVFHCKLSIRAEVRSGNLNRRARCNKGREKSHKDERERQENSRA